MEVDLEGGRGGGSVIDDSPGYDHTFEVSKDDEDATEAQFPTHEYGPSDEDNEEGNTQDDGSDEVNKVNDTDDDPNSDGDEDVSDDDDSAHTTDQILRAGRLGMPAEKLGMFKGASLDAHLDYIESTSTQGQESGYKDNGGDSGYEEPTAFEPTITSDEYEESLVDDISGLSQHINGQMQSTHKIIEQVASAVMSQQYNMLDAEVNEAIDSLAGSPGLDFETTLGAGTDGFVPKGSLAENNRQRVISEIESMQQERARTGYPPMTTQRAFTEAVKTVTGEDISTNNQKVQRKSASRKSNISQRKGRKNTKRASNDSAERNKRSVAAWSGLDD